MAALVKQTGSGYTIDISIVGTFDEVTEAVNDLNARYPAPGYGTRIKWPPNDPPNLIGIAGIAKPAQTPDGLWQAWGYRHSSCD